MKKGILFYLITLVGLNCIGQTNFEKGYFVNNAGETIDCLIKNIDWKDNPTEFQYKLSENAELKIAKIRAVKEFEISNISKYVRAQVNVDRSSSNIDNLTDYRNPDFKEELLFLKLLLDGKANLYYYEDGNLKRFFYSIENSSIEQLVYKTYRKGELTTIGENNYFKQQLLNSLKCSSITASDIQDIDYEKKDLVYLFEKHNTCTNSQSINFQKKPQRNPFNLSARLGLSNSSLEIQNNSSTSSSIQFGNELGLRFGLEAEFILPFNNNKWAIILEPTLENYVPAKQVNDDGFLNYDIVANYKTFELPFGIRHYFFLNDKSKVFLNAAYALVFPIDSKIDFGTGSIIEINKSSAYELGLGFNYNNKLSAELRFGVTPEILGTYVNWSSNYKRLSLIFGYTIF